MDCHCNRRLLGCCFMNYCAKIKQNSSENVLYVCIFNLYSMHQYLRFFNTYSFGSGMGCVHTDTRTGANIKSYILKGQFWWLSSCIAPEFDGWHAGLNKPNQLGNRVG